MNGVIEGGEMKNNKIIYDFIFEIHVLFEGQYKRKTLIYEWNN